MCKVFCKLKSTQRLRLESECSRWWWEAWRAHRLLCMTVSMLNLPPRYACPHHRAVRFLKRSICHIVLAICHGRWLCTMGVYSLTCQKIYRASLQKANKWNLLAILRPLHWQNWANTCQVWVWELMISCFVFTFCASTGSEIKARRPGSSRHAAASSWACPGAQACAPLAQGSLKRKLSLWFQFVIADWGEQH